MPLYKVRPNFRHGARDQYGPGDVVELDEESGKQFQDKLELLPPEPPPAPAEPEIVAPEPTAEPEIVAPEPTAEPEIVAPGPTAEPEIVAPGPTAEPEIVAPEPTAEPEPVAPEPPKKAKRGNA